MRKFLTALIVISLGLILVTFAVANRHFVTVSFDPFMANDPALSVTLPLFLLLIAGGCARASSPAAAPSGSASGTGGARRAGMRRMPGPPGASWPICGPRRPRPSPSPSASRCPPGWAFTGPSGETSSARRCRSGPTEKPVSRPPTCGLHLL